MIGWLKGTISHYQDPSILIQNNGIGYIVNLGTNTKKKLLHATDFVRVELYIYTLIRETELTLYGFQNIEQRDLFEMLLNINGVGPKAAMKIIDELGERNFIVSIRDKNSASLEKIPGIGKKIAQRIILELEKKVEKKYNYFDLPVTRVDDNHNQTVENLKSALLNLGFSEQDVLDAIHNNYQSNKNFEKSLILCLQSLNKSNKFLSQKHHG